MNSRERFEATFRHEWGMTRDGDDYSWGGTQLLWEGWQAAEAAAAKRCAEICRERSLLVGEGWTAFDACAADIEAEFGLKD